MQLCSQESCLPSWPSVVHLSNGLRRWQESRIHKREKGTRKHHVQSCQGMRSGRGKPRQNPAISPLGWAELLGELAAHGSTLSPLLEEAEKQDCVSGHHLDAIAVSCHPVSALIKCSFLEPLKSLYIDRISPTQGTSYLLTPLSSPLSSVVTEPWFSAGIAAF